MNEKLKKTRNSSKGKSESFPDEMEKQKGMTLFDHIKHIEKIQNVDYYNNLTDLDKKTFNHFMILRGLSMNADLLDDVSFIFRYFDVIPSPQFYKLLISIIPINNKFNAWIKSKKNKKYSDELIELISRKFETSEKESIEYLELFNLTESGQKELKTICQGFGLNDREVDKILTYD